MARRIQHCVMRRKAGSNRWSRLDCGSAKSAERLKRDMRRADPTYAYEVRVYDMSSGAQLMGRSRELQYCVRAIPIGSSRGGLVENSCGFGAHAYARAERMVARLSKRDPHHRFEITAYDRGRKLYGVRRGRSKTPRGCAKSTSIQTLLFPCKGRSKAACSKAAKAWAKRNRFRYGKTDCKTPKYCRVRQVPPSKFCRGTLRTKALRSRSGVKAVIGKRKKGV